MTLSTPQSRQQLIEGLRALADLYENDPHLYDDGMKLTVNMYAWGDQARKAVVSVTKLEPHAVAVDQRNVSVTAPINDRVSLTIFASRESVCTRVVRSREVEEWEFDGLLIGGAK